MLRPTYAKEGDQRNARMNREVCLTSFNIDKVNPLGDATEDMSLEEMRQLEQQERWRIALCLVEIIKRIKLNFTGNIYNDFFHLGEPYCMAFEEKQKGMIQMIQPPELRSALL